MGTIASFAAGRPDLKELLTKLENFDICGEYMLTEVAHGLDARNLEITARQQANGDFVLNTPSRGAIKAMPPTGIVAGLPRIAVVFARLIVEHKDRGIRPFLVPLNDGETMCPGVISKMLPARSGTAYSLDHSLTEFRNVHLPRSALLDSPLVCVDLRQHFLKQTWRIAVGGLALTMTFIPCLRQACYITSRYHSGRYRDENTGQTTLSLGNVYRPILVGLAQAAVFEQYARWSVKAFLDPTTTDDEKRGIVTTFKAVLVRDTQATLKVLRPCCGWTSEYDFNGIPDLESLVRANAIAEGTVSVLSIRLTSELLLGRYSLPPPQWPDSPLAMYEKHVFSTFQKQMDLIYSQKKRTDPRLAFGAILSPYCNELAEAIGQRMAYDAAMASGVVPMELINVFESNCLRVCKTLSGTQLNKDAEAIAQMLPMLQGLLEEADCSEYVPESITSDSGWNAAIKPLPTFGNDEDKQASTNVSGILVAAASNTVSDVLTGCQAML